MSTTPCRRMNQPRRNHRRSEQPVLVESAGVDQPALVDHHVQAAIAEVDLAIQELIRLVEMNGLRIYP